MLTYKQIMFPIDISIDPQTCSRDLTMMLPHVKIMENQFNAVVHLVYVAKTNEYYREDECETGQAKCEPGQIITRTFGEFAETHCSTLSNTRVVVLDGNPETELLNYIKTAQIDLVIMTSKKKSAVGKAVFGSVAGTIVREADIPVLIVS